MLVNISTYLCGKSQTLKPKSLFLFIQIVSSPADGVDFVKKSRTSLSSPKSQPRKKKSSTINKKKMLPLESSGMSSNEFPTTSNDSTSLYQVSLSSYISINSLLSLTRSALLVEFLFHIHMLILLYSELCIWTGL